MLGCGGAVETLRRTASGPADLTRSIQIEDLCEDAIVDWLALLPHLPIVDIPLPLARDLLQGREYALEAFIPFAQHLSDQLAIYRLQGRDESCGILKCNAGKWGYLVSAMPQFGLGKSD